MKGIKKHATNYFIHHPITSVYHLRGSKKNIKPDISGFFCFIFCNSGPETGPEDLRQDLRT